jgi:hypothetical protein
LEARNTGHLPLPGTWQCTSGNNSQGGIEIMKRLSVKSVELVSIFTEAGKKLNFKYHTV